MKFALCYLQSPCNSRCTDWLHPTCAQSAFLCCRCTLFCLFVCLFVYIYIYLEKQSKIEKRDTGVSLLHLTEHDIFAEDKISGAIIVVAAAQMEHSRPDLAQMHLIVLDNQLSILICWYHLQKKNQVSDPKPLTDPLHLLPPYTFQNINYFFSGVFGQMPKYAQMLLELFLSRNCNREF